MKILHVSIGNPENHEGGLSRYCLELMQEQEKAGAKTVLLYPGEFTVSGRTDIKRDKTCGRITFCIRNPLPKALTYGINNPKRYLSPCASLCYETFLKNLKPDIIHVHSIMGIHKELFESAKQLSIPVVFTTHDYYPICPKCALFDYKSTVCEDKSSSKCAQCNRDGGLSSIKQRVIQSKIYRKIKSTALIKRAKSSRLMQPTSSNQDGCKLSPLSEQKIQEYATLDAYYKKILSYVDIVHCNSKATQEVYFQYFPELNYQVVPITHNALERFEHERQDDNVLHIGYMGGASKHKGIDILLKAVFLLNERELNHWKLCFYGGELPNILKNDNRIYNGGYFTKGQEEQVWKNIDILVVPSQWRETFGFVVLEALCRGIPVICSDLVGSRYLVESLSYPLVFKHDVVTDLVDKLAMFMSNPDLYTDVTEEIKKMKLPIDMKEHSDEMLKLYENCIKTKNEEVRNDSNTQQNYK